MRWTTHQVGAVGLALILKLPAAGILAANALRKRRTAAA